MLLAATTITSISSCCKLCHFHGDRTQSGDICCGWQTIFYCQGLQTSSSCQKHWHAWFPLFFSLNSPSESLLHFAWMYRKMTFNASEHSKKAASCTGFIVVCQLHVFPDIQEHCLYSVMKNYFLMKIGFHFIKKKTGSTFDISIGPIEIGRNWGRVGNLDATLVLRCLSEPESKADLRSVKISEIAQKLTEIATFSQSGAISNLT